MLPFRLLDDVKRTDATGLVSALAIGLNINSVFYGSTMPAMDATVTVGWCFH